MAGDKGSKSLGNVLTLEEFEIVIDEMRAAHDVPKAIKDVIAVGQKPAGNSGLADFFDPWCLFSAHLDTLVKVLSRMFQDEDGWLEWWLWECDYGRDELLLSTAYDADGNRIPMGTAEDLYAHLVRGLAAKADEE